MSHSLEMLKKKLHGSNQEHVLAFWDELNEKERDSLSKQIFQVSSFSHLNNVLESSLALLDKHKDLHKSAISVQPPPESCIFNTTSSENCERVAEYNKKGLELIAEGETAVLLMAGGSGTRLGVSTPKGMFICPLLKQQKSLFQLYCEMLVRVQCLARERRREGSHENDRCKIPFLIMTSEQNHKETSHFFEENFFFGLDKSQVYFFTQTSLPCYDEKSGKILMESKSSICLAPGGNGGVYESLANSGLLSVLKGNGVKYVQIFGVDNLLAAVADPIFFGYAALEEKEVAVKTTAKTSPTEKVGVYALADEKWGVIEYTEIGEARAEERNPISKELMFNCANIAFHVCSVSFLQLAAEKMKSETRYHAAKKVIHTLSGKVEAVKLEAFIFDMFSWCNQVSSFKKKNLDAFGVVQVNRSEEFAPIKNGISSSTDNPVTAVNLLHQLHSKRVKNVLKRVPSSSLLAAEAENALKRLEQEEVLVEISPLVSFRDEGLEAIQKDIISSVLQAPGGDTLVLQKVSYPLSKC